MFAGVFEGCFGKRGVFLMVFCGELVVDCGEDRGCSMVVVLV